MNKRILISVKEMKDLINGISDESKIYIKLEDEEFEIQVLEILDNKSFKKGKSRGGERWMIQ